MVTRLMKLSSYENSLAQGLWRLKDLPFLSYYSGKWSDPSISLLYSRFAFGLSKLITTIVWLFWSPAFWG